MADIIVAIIVLGIPVLFIFGIVKFVKWIIKASKEEAVREKAEWEAMTPEQQLEEKRKKRFN